MTGKGQTVFETPWFQIAVVDPGPEASGTTAPYYCLVRPSGIIAFVVDREGRLALIEQYRPPLRRTTLEMPAGTIEPGETPDEAVAREVMEETGLVCERWYQISPCRLMLNREDVIDYFYVGLGAHKSGEFERSERGVLRLLPRQEVLDLVRSRRFEQTAALGGVYLTEKIFGLDLFQADPDAIAAKLADGL